MQWAISVDDDAASLEGEVRDKVSVYLVPSDPRGKDESAPADEWFAEVFARELEDWYVDESTWPVQDLKTFLEWFEVTTHSLVVDLGSGPLRAVEL